MFKRYGIYEAPVTPNNVCGLNPDGYLVIPERVVPFNWMGNMETCGESFEELKKAIKDNGETAINLFAEIAATPAKVEVTGFWFENMKPIKGLHIKLELTDIYGDVIEALPDYANIDLGEDPKGDCIDPCLKNCGETGIDTFVKYRTDTSKNKSLIGRGNSAILKLTIIEEPTKGLLSECPVGVLPMFRGGLLYKSFCNVRNIVSQDDEDFTHLDGATTAGMAKWKASDRKTEVGE